MTTIVRAICNKEGLNYQSSQLLEGGDINDAYLISTRNKRYFLKINASSLYPLMFKKETEGLKALQQQSMIKAPEVLAAGEFEDKQYLLLQWLESANTSPNFWETFADGMAQLHRVTNPCFGWISSNYIGSLAQQNEYKESWATFYTAQRIMPLVERLFNGSLLSKSDADAAEKLCERLVEIFPPEVPSLLHGDLWSGNFMAINDPEFPEHTTPAIFDPAVYFGHREMDLGMSLLFGGFHSRFYEAYHSFFPLESGWKKRVSLTQLYPLLVHAILFRGGYIKQCSTILQNWGG